MEIVIIIIVVLLILVAVGWKDRYKGIEHLKPKHVKDKETREYIEMVDNDPDAHADAIKKRIDKAMEEHSKEEDDK